MQKREYSTEERAELVIDFTKAVLDLSYEGLTVVTAPKVTGDQVKALLLSGNPLAELDFTHRFPSLELLQIDGVGLKDFYELALHQFPALKHLLARVNNLETFQYFSSSQSLQSIDLSQNCFDYNAEDAIAASFPSLRSIQFGFATKNIPAHGQVHSLSQTRINTIKLFDKLFTKPLETSNCRVDREEASVSLQDGYVFTMQLVGNQLVITLEKDGGHAKNNAIQLKAFSILTGFQIVLLNTLNLRVKDFFDDVDLNIHELFQGSEKIVQYPTDSILQGLDAQAIALVNQRARQQLQLGDGLPSFWVLQLVMKGDAVNFFIDPREACFLDGAELEAQIQLEINSQKGIQFGIKYAGPPRAIKDTKQQPIEREVVPEDLRPEQTVSLLYNSSTSNQHEIKARPDVSQIHLIQRNYSRIVKPLLIAHTAGIETTGAYSFVHYYTSSKRQSQLLSEIVDTIFTLSDIQISMPSAMKLLQEALRDFNSEMKGQLSKNAVVLGITYNGKKTPLKIALEKQFVGDQENQFVIPIAVHSKLLAVQIFYKENIVTLIDGPVRAQASSLQIALEKNERVDCFVYQVLESGEKLLCDQEDFVFTFYLNNEQIQAGSDPTCPLQGKGRYAVEVVWLGEGLNLGRQEMTVL